MSKAYDESVRQEQDWQSLRSQLIREGSIVLYDGKGLPKREPRTKSGGKAKKVEAQYEVAGK